MPDATQSPLTLTAMSLRGIGSYFHGAKLEIRPLTIICGTNGSGKSTWFRALNILNSSKHKLPAGMESDAADGYGLLNSRYDFHDETLPTAKDEFGEPGSIGLDLTATAPCVVLGESLQRGSEISFRFTYPNELSWSDERREVTGKTEVRIDKRVISTSDESIRRVILDFFGGYFFLGAIRRIERDFHKIVEDLNEKSHQNLRYVGEDGKYTHALANLYKREPFNDSDLAKVIAKFINECEAANLTIMGELEYGTFRDYYSSWLHQLLEINADDGRSLMTVADYEALCKWRRGGNEGHFSMPSRSDWKVFEAFIEAVNKTHPTGFLSAPLNEPPKPKDEDDYENVRCYGNSLISKEASPANLSAGFHQIAPMIVQAGLMKKGELLCIENPEVHLHPGLQLKLTEFLIKMAESGRQIVVETHSDLIVRRVMRAILSEEIAQQSVNIYFASVAKDADGNATSKLEKIKINDKGRVENWPEGFLDDDVKESSRLMDAMYGGSPAPFDDDDEPKGEAP